MKQLKFLTLAALLVLPLAACDEGEDPVQAVSGTVTGTVTIDGQGASGISVALSSGQSATTDASGRYTFSDIAAGAYTVTISGQPADVTFDALSKAVVISTSGTQTVDFSGQSIRTSAITGEVTSGGEDLSGVTVTLSGDGTGSATTDAEGRYSFSGLGAGDYTVALSGLPDGVGCAETSKSVTLETGEAQVVDFSCNPAGAGTVSGTLYIDGNENDVFETGLEEALAAGNVTITLEGPDIGETRTTVTNEDGTFSFTDLVSGTYNVCIDDEDEQIPENVVYGGASDCFTRTLSGGGATVDFPFNIVQQTVVVGAFLGDEEDPRIAPVAGAVIELYPTEEDLNALTNVLDTDTTDADGEAQLVFDREDDTSPGDDETSDEIVFARLVSAPDFHEVQGPSQMEINYDPTTAVYEDGEFTFLNRELVFGFHALSTETAEPLEGWNAALWLNDTTAVSTQAEVTDSTGFVEFRDAVASANLPDTFWMRLSGAQPQAFGHAFDQNAEAEAGDALNVRWLRIIHNGLVPAADTVDVGNEIVSFRTANLLVRAFHEADDTIKMTGGDDVENVDNLRISLLLDGDTIATETPLVSDGSVTFTNLETNAGDYTVTATSVLPDQQVVISDTIVDVQVLNGSSHAVYECPLGADTLGTPESCGTFAYKYNNGFITGKVKSADSTAAEGAKVRVEAMERNIGPSPVDTTLVTDSNGMFILEAMREGPYLVSVMDSVTSAGDTVWSVREGFNRSDTVDIQGNADNDILNFIVTRHDTEIQGVVVNDRDADTNVIDVNEALANVTIELHADSLEGELVATTTTNNEGAFTFSNLREGNYTLRALATDEAVVLRGYNADGTVVDWVTVTTAAAPATADNQNTRRTVGSTEPTPLPRWDYDMSVAENVAPSHFTFLYSNTEARGTVVDGSGDPVVGMTVTLRRCDDSTGAVSPPSATTQTCTTYFTGFTAQNTVTDASGEFSFTGLTEGVYEVDPQPTTVTGFTSTAPASTLYLLVGASDIEAREFTAN